MVPALGHVQRYIFIFASPWGATALRAKSRPKCPCDKLTACGGWRDHRKSIEKPSESNQLAVLRLFPIQGGRPGAGRAIKQPKGRGARPGARLLKGRPEGRPGDSAKPSGPEKWHIANARNFVTAQRSSGSCLGSWPRISSILGVYAASSFRKAHWRRGGGLAPPTFSNGFWVRREAR